MHFSQIRGPVVPVTVFLEVSGFPDAATAMQALNDARADLEKAKARKALLDAERSQRFPDPKNWYWRERWEALNDYEEAGWQVRSCQNALADVEVRMGLFHPKHRALLAGWVESAIGLLDALDASQSEDEPAFEIVGKAIMGGPGCALSDPDHVDDDPEEEEGVLIPDYGEDQTAGPINYRATTN